MSPRNWLMRIEDIVSAIDATIDYTGGMTLDSFKHDKKTIDAVMHNIMVIGEAANHVPNMVMEQHPEIPWGKMRAIRNVIVHAYFGVRTDILWQTIQHDLPPLVDPLKNLLKEHS